MHVFTGNGKASAISGMDKINSLKKVAKDEKLQKAFTDLGTTGKIKSSSPFKARTTMSKT